MLEIECQWLTSTKKPKTKTKTRKEEALKSTFPVRYSIPAARTHAHTSHTCFNVMQHNTHMHTKYNETLLWSDKQKQGVGGWLPWGGVLLPCFLGLHGDQETLQQGCNRSQSGVLLLGRGRNGVQMKSLFTLTKCQQVLLFLLGGGAEFCVLIGY